MSEQQVVSKSSTNPKMKPKPQAKKSEIKPRGGIAVLTAGRKTQNEGKYNPFAASSDLNKIKDEEQAKADAEQARINAEQARRQREKEEATRKAKEDQEREKYGKIWKLADDARHRHPDLPNDIYHKMKTSPTRGEAKRILRNHLTTQTVVA